MHGHSTWRDWRDTHMLLVGTPKGAFILDGGATGPTGRCRGRSARAGRSTTSSGIPRPARSTPAAARRGTGRPCSGATISATTWTPLVGRADVRRRRPEDPDDLERHAGPRLDLRGRRAGRTVPERRRRRDLEPRRRRCATTRAAEPGWQPGAGGLICHTIVPHPTDPAKMWVAISAVGTFATEDGGATWEARNRGVVDCNSPEPHPETGQCVHKLVMAAGDPDRLYQQNHCGVYRSSRRRPELARHQRRPLVRVRVRDGRPSARSADRLGHPAQPSRGGPDRARTARSPSGGRAMRGDTWERHGEGLPQQNAFVGVLREAMAVDRLDPVGVFFGTSTGQLYGSRRRGRDVATSSPTTCRRSGASRRSTSTEATACRRRSSCRDRSSA